VPLLVKAVADALQAEGFTDGASSPVYFVGFERATPDFAVTVIPEAGSPPQRSLGNFPGFSVVVRHPDGTKANEVLADIFRFLQDRGAGSGSARFSGLPIARIFASAGVVQLGFDLDGGQGRWRVSQTFQAIVRQT
jgi:hypothetical protein